MPIFSTSSVVSRSPAGVDDVEGNALDLDGLAQGVAGGAGDVGDDGPLLAGETVEQAGLADVGLTNEHHMQAIAQQAALAGAVEDGAQFGSNNLDALEGLGLDQKVHVLVGKIEGRLDQHAQVDQALTQALDFAGETAGEGSGPPSGLLRPWRPR